MDLILNTTPVINFKAKRLTIPIWRNAMKSLILAALTSITISSSAYSDTYVNGYYKSNGTYVAPHYRSSPDSTINNNWSTRPNINPYTGRRGTRAPQLYYPRQNPILNYMQRPIKQY